MQISTVHWIIKCVSNISSLWISLNVSYIYCIGQFYVAYDKRRRYIINKQIASYIRHDPRLRYCDFEKLYKLRSNRM